MYALCHDLTDLFLFLFISLELKDVLDDVVAKDVVY